jgi:hypothetical protein
LNHIVSEVKSGPSHFALEDANDLEDEEPAGDALVEESLATAGIYIFDLSFILTNLSSC